MNEQQAPLIQPAPGLEAFYPVIPSLHLLVLNIGAYRSIRPPDEQQPAPILRKGKDMPRITIDPETRAMLRNIAPLAIAFVEQ